MIATFGLPDEQFKRGDIPMTKREIRIFAMAQAAVRPSDIIWDIGAGTGSLSVESALQASEGKVYAIERNPEGCSLIRENAARFGCSNIETICGSAPETFKELPDPDLIWVGGSGGNLREILLIGAERLRVGGRMIILSILAETLQESLSFAAQQPFFSYEACGLQVTRIEPVKSRHMMRGLNPIFIIVCRKGAEK